MAPKRPVGSGRKDRMRHIRALLIENSFFSLHLYPVNLCCYISAMTKYSEHSSLEFSVQTTKPSLNRSIKPLLLSVLEML